MSTLIKTLFNKYNAPREKEKYNSCEGSEIYKYKYFDKKAKEWKDEEINIQEKIQSFISQVDYKKRIELGLGLEAPLLNENLTRDFTGIPDSTVDIVNLVNAISGLSEDQIANLLQQSSGTVQAESETGQTVDNTSEVTTEETSPSSTINTTTTGTGE